VDELPLHERSRLPAELLVAVAVHFGLDAWLEHLQQEAEPGDDLDVMRADFEVTAHAGAAEHEPPVFPAPVEIELLFQARGDPFRRAGNRGRGACAPLLP